MTEYKYHSKKWSNSINKYKFCWASQKEGLKDQFWVSQGDAKFAKSSDDWSQLQMQTASNPYNSPCETQNWSWRPSFWEAQQNLYLYLVIDFDHFWEAQWYLYLVIIGKPNNSRIGIRSYLGSRIIFVLVFGRFWETEWYSYSCSSFLGNRLIFVFLFGHFLETE